MSDSKLIKGECDCKYFIANAKRYEYNILIVGVGFRQIFVLECVKHSFWGNIVEGS